MLAKQLVVAAGLLTLASATPTKRCFGPTVAITVRGTDPDADSFNDDPNPGDAILADIATKAIPGIYVNPLSYPATGIKDPSMYGQSIAIGVDHLAGLVDYILGNTCNGAATKIVMLGYSQGATVISTYIGGGSGHAALAQGSKELNAIAGGVLIADPSFVGNLSPLDDHSDFKSGNGGIPNGNNQVTLNQLKGSVFAQLCEYNDHWCANGGDAGDPNYTIHSNEEGYWHDRAISYLQGLHIS